MLLIRVFKFFLYNISCEYPKKDLTLNVIGS
jgi:hypothetical protein